jgi:hypothetical protein
LIDIIIADNQLVVQEDDVTKKKLLTLQQTKTFYHEEDFIGFGHYGYGGGCAGAGSAAKL